MENQVNNMQNKAENSASTSSMTNSELKKYTENGYKLLVNASRAVAAMPSGASRDLYSAYPSYTKIMDLQATHILGIISEVLKLQQIRGSILRRDKEEKLELLQDCNDAMLEKINSNLDEMEGVKKKSETVLVHTELRLPSEPSYKPSGSWNEKSIAKERAVKATLITGTNIARPQIKFQIPLDNSALNPFVPKIKVKPNSIKPLAVLPEYDESGNISSYLHPYEIELNKFEPKEAQMKPVETLIEPLPISDTPFIYVENGQQLKKCMEELKEVSEIAVDLEHHSYRTYQGFTCLVQISTRTKDYVIDALALREELHVLNEIFTNPKVVKVFHGSKCDIEWLQRDLSVYVVNMFDTGEAARVLEFSRLGLQFLLKHYCDIELDKTYQLADWRIRPLPSNFLEYARKDTHYLLYVFDRMRNELLEKGVNLLKSVYDKSTWLCQQKYVKPTIDEDVIMNIYRRSKHVFDQRQIFAFREILYWRDKIARMEDESPGYVLPQHMALDIAAKLPKEMHGILSCCTPIPSLVRQHLHTLHLIILKARDIPVNKAILAPAQNQDQDNRHKIEANFNLNNPLNCPHDMPQIFDVQTNLPTLLENADKFLISPKTEKLCKLEPILSVFEDAKTLPDQFGLKKTKFYTPFERHFETCKYKYKEENLALPSFDDVEVVVKTEMTTNEQPTEVVPNGNQVKEEENIPLKRMKNKKRKHIREENNQEAVVDPKIAKQEVPTIDVSKDNSNDEDEEVNEKMKKTLKNRKKAEKKNKFKKNQVSHKSFRQTSNKPVPFDYTKVDYSRFQGGSSSQQSGSSDKQKNKKKQLHPNSRLGKSVARCQKMFNFSSVHLKK